MGHFTGTMDVGEFPGSVISRVEISIGWYTSNGAGRCPEIYPQIGYSAVLDFTKFGGEITKLRLDEKNATPGKSTMPISSAWENTYLALASECKQTLGKSNIGIADDGMWTALTEALHTVDAWFHNEGLRILRR